jgi:aminopeptidase
MVNTELLGEYARLIVRGGVNVQPGQLVAVSAEAAHRELAVLIAEEAYVCGARYVDIDIEEPRLLRTRLTQSRPEDLSYVPPYTIEKYKLLLESRGANIKIVGPEFPGILSNLNQKLLNATRSAQYQALKFFYDDGILQSHVYWTVVAAPTPRWAKRVFPMLSEELATEELWNQILRCCRITGGDALEEWKRHHEVLSHRAKLLTDLKIEKLHFEGPGTDLWVGLSPLAIFRGGSECSSEGREFMPNIPSEEVFTTPDTRLTNGRVRATRPFLVNGTLIRDLAFVFENGRISSFTASEGSEAFQAYLDRDEGSRQLGEVALVGIDSPIYRTGTIFEEILFDENAACHIAIGSAYKFCLQDGHKLSQEELAQIGCNESSIHTDIMISSDEVSVTAHAYDGTVHQILRDGAWDPRYAG